MNQPDYVIEASGDALAERLADDVAGMLNAAVAERFVIGGHCGRRHIVEKDPNFAGFDIANNANLMPLVIPLCWAILEVNGIADARHMHILYACIACVLTGAVWADHCSPISDTTVLSCLATGCDLMDHVTTQIPYALLGGITALLVCVIPTGYGLPWWLGLLVGAAVLFTALVLIGRRADTP